MIKKMNIIAKPVNLKGNQEVYKFEKPFSSQEMNQ